MHLGIAIIERDIGGFYGELAAMRHGIARVHRQIHDDLLNLAGVGLHRAEIRSRNHGQIDVFANNSREHLGVFGHHAVEIHHLRRDHLFAAKGEQLAGEPGGAFGGAGNFVHQTVRSSGSLAVRSARNSQ